MAGILYSRSVTRQARPAISVSRPSIASEILRSRSSFSHADETECPELVLITYNLSGVENGESSRFKQLLGTDQKIRPCIPAYRLPFFAATVAQLQLIKLVSYFCVSPVFLRLQSLMPQVLSFRGRIASSDGRAFKISFWSLHSHLQQPGRPEISSNEQTWARAWLVNIC